MVWSSQGYHPVPGCEISVELYLRYLSVSVVLRIPGQGVYVVTPLGRSTTIRDCRLGIVT